MTPRSIACVALGLAMALAVMAGISAAGKDRGQRSPEPDPSGPLRIDETAFELSAVTGGDFYFWAPGEFAASPPLTIPLESEPIALVAGRLDTTGGSLRIEVPVDGTVGRLSIFAGVQRRDRLAISLPDGSSALGLDREATVQQTRHMLIVTLAAPQPGVWQVEVAGSGLYMVTARAGRSRAAGAPSLIELIDFDFVELRGRPGHEGYFPVETLPAAGSEALCSVVLAGAIGDVSFGFHDGAGRVIEELDLVRGQAGVAADTWLGPCRVPRSAFRLAAVGADASGHRMQRVMGALLDPNAVLLTPEEIERILREAEVGE